MLGSVMVIPNISRHCAGIYECEASNGVPPLVNRQMKITVECKLSYWLPGFSLRLGLFVTGAHAGGGRRGGPGPP